MLRRSRPSGSPAAVALPRCLRDTGLHPPGSGTEVRVGNLVFAQGCPLGSGKAAPIAPRAGGCSGIALLEREHSLHLHAVDRSAEMQVVGEKRALALGHRIASAFSDVHTLPPPDDYFDVVTLQFASRRLGVRRVFSKIRRALRPGGRLPACDMLRPVNRFVELA